MAFGPGFQGWLGFDPEDTGAGEVNSKWREQVDTGVKARTC